jgi:GDPmannose 4,6-dehydratase
MTDSSSLYNLIRNILPDEIYNLAAQSHVAVSFEQPEYTANADALGTLRILEAIRPLKLNKTKFYQAGTSELFGGSNKVSQNENTPFYPKSPYGVAKLYAHWITVNYRESYNIFASNGILFNHESPVRGETFVTRKIVIGLCKIKKKKIKKLYVGNLYAKRDWGHASDYVKAMWLILQQPKPDDFVIATGKQYTVKHFINLVAKELNIKLHWKGKGINEKAFDENEKVVIECHKNYFRPSEVNNLLGDYNKAKRILGWKPKINIQSLVKEMVKKDFDRV